MPIGKGKTALPANQSRITLYVHGEPLPVVALNGEEHLSQPFSFTLEALVDKYLRLASVIGAPATLQLTGNDGIARNVVGIIRHYEDLGLNHDGRLRAQLQLSSQLTLLQQQRDNRVILGHTVPDIVRHACERNGIAHDHLRFELNQTYPVRPYIVQAMETDLAFITRLLGQDGIYFYSLAEDHSEIIVFTDYNAHCPYLAREVLAFHPPTGLPKTNDGSPHIGLHRLMVTHRLVTARFGVQDVNEDTPSTPLQCATDCSAPGTNNQTTQAMHHGMGTRAIEHTEHLSRVFAERARVSAAELTADGNVIDMAAGHVFSLEATEFDARHSGDWLVTGVTHTASQTAGQQVAGDDVSYRHTAICIQREVPYRPEVPTHPDLPQTFSARIESDGPYARLDEQGRYQLRNLFDVSARAHTQASIPLRRLSPYGGPPSASTVGLHTPLHDGDEVLLSCLNGDPNRPMLVGTAPNPDRQSPVTAQNPAQNRLRTATDNELCLDDTQDAECITLRTFEGHNILQLNMAAVGHQIQLATKHGAMAQWAKKTHGMQSGDTLTERVGNDRTQIIENKHQTTTNKAEIHQQAKTDHKHTAHHFIKTDSGKNTELTAGKHVKIDVTNNAKITMHGANGFHATIQNGNVTVNAANDIRVTGKGGGDITFEQSGGGFKVKANGDVALYGKNVQLGGSGGVTFNGNVSYSIGAPSIPAAASVTAPTARSTLRDLLDNAQPAPPPDTPWLDLEYTYHDKEPVQGAEFKITFSDGSQQTGKLNSEGKAHLENVPAGPFHVEYGEDERDWQPKDKDEPKTPNANHQAAFSEADAPALKHKVEQDPSLVDSVGDAVSDVGSWIWGVIQGDFNQEMSTSQTIVASVITMIPIVDQVADVRDITANVITLSDEKEREEPMNWVILAVTLIGLIPVLGSALKGIFKVLIKNLDAAGDVIFDMLRKLGHGDPQRFLKNLDWPGMTKDVQNFFQDAIGRLKAVINYARESRTVSWFTDKETVKMLGEKARQLDELAAMGNRKLEEAMGWLKTKVDDLTKREHVAKSSHGRTEKLNESITEERDLVRTSPKATDSDFQTKGLNVDPLSIPEGRQLLAEVRKANPEASDDQVYRWAKGMLNSGKEVPKVSKALPNTRLYKVVPQGKGVTTHSAYFMDKTQLDDLAKNPEIIPDKMALPKQSEADVYDVFEISPQEGKNPVIFESTTAPTQEGGLARAGGGQQSIVPNRGEWTEPALVDVIKPK